MSFEIIKKIYFKILDKQKYDNYKNSKKVKENIEYYQNNIKEKISNIHAALERKKSLSFLHSGHLGDLMYSLPLVKELAKNYECNYYVQVDKKTNVNYGSHPSGDVFINKKTARLMLPLLKSQNYFKNVEVYNGEEIDINLDLFRDIPISFYFHSTRWYMHLTGTQFDMTSPCLDVVPHKDIKDKIVIMRSPRYRNIYIDYKMLKNVSNIVCVGLESEYQDLKKDVPNLEFYDCKDFLEMAQIIRSSKFFIGNLCFAYSVAEGLKIPRLLEASPEFPVVFPTGKNGYDFYHQLHFKKYFDLLNK